MSARLYFVSYWPLELWYRCTCMLTPKSKAKHAYTWPCVVRHGSVPTYCMLDICDKSARWACMQLVAHTLGALQVCHS